MAIELDLKSEILKAPSKSKATIDKGGELVIKEVKMLKAGTYTSSNGSEVDVTEDAINNTNWKERLNGKPIVESHKAIDGDNYRLNTVGTVLNPTVFNSELYADVVVADNKTKHNVMDGIAPAVSLGLRDIGSDAIGNVNHVALTDSPQVEEALLHLSKNKTNEVKEMPKVKEKKEVVANEVEAEKSIDLSSADNTKEALQMKLEKLQKELKDKSDALAEHARNEKKQADLAKQKKAEDELQKRVNRNAELASVLKLELSNDIDENEAKILEASKTHLESMATDIDLSNKSDAEIVSMAELAKVSKTKRVKVAQTTEVEGGNYDLGTQYTKDTNERVAAEREAAIIGVR